jgi:hypothetical protein
MLIIFYFFVIYINLKKIELLTLERNEKFNKIFENYFFKIKQTKEDVDGWQSKLKLYFSDANLIFEKIFKSFNKDELFLKFFFKNSFLIIKFNV